MSRWRDHDSWEGSLDDWKTRSDREGEMDDHEWSGFCQFCYVGRHKRCSAQNCVCFNARHFDIDFDRKLVLRRD